MDRVSAPYKNRLLAHLAGYRRTVLGVKQAGTFRHRGRVIPVEHVLPAGVSKWLNIPEEVRGQVQAAVEKYEVKLHRYFHHLNSSQAFALALFVPFFERPASARTLLRALGIEGDVQNWRPEAIPDATEGTNLDAWWITTPGVEYFCEVKLTEDGFGAALSDARHMSKLREIYRPRLDGLVAPSGLEPDEFFGAYQIFRNLWHAAGSPSSRVLFLFPRGQVSLGKQLDSVLRVVTASLRERVLIAHTEDVLTRLSTDPEDSQESQRYAQILATKYLPTMA